MSGGNLGSRGRQRRLGAAHACPVIVQFLGRSCSFCGERTRPGEATIGGIQFGLALRHLRLRGGDIALAQHDLGLAGCRGVHGLLAPCLGFIALRIERGELHPRERLPRADEVAFAHQDFLDPAPAAW